MILHIMPELHGSLPEPNVSDKLLDVLVVDVKHVEIYKYLRECYLC